MVNLCVQAKQRGLAWSPPARKVIMGYLFAILLPPVAILYCGKPIQAFLNIFLTLCGWVPGVVHALFVVHHEHEEKRTRRIERALYMSAAARDHRYE